MKVSSETQIFISVASKPGRFGATVFNQLFKENKLNAIYLPRVAPSAESLILSMRALQISGCGVSMPLKGKVIPELDIVDPLAEEAQSVNTIKNDHGKLKGYNTDIFGCQKTLEKRTPKSILIYGSGCVVNSIIIAAKFLQIKDITIMARNSKKVEDKAQLHQVKPINFTSIISAKKRYDMMINATPAGERIDEEIFSLLDHCKEVFDLKVSTHPSLLIKQAQKQGLLFREGIEMAKFQLQKQFEIYTELTIDSLHINNIIQASYKSSG